MIDILYLGVNMGNCGYRFFCRYPEAEKDYYDGFKWLLRLKKERPELNIAIKHHPGDYNVQSDDKEMDLMRNSSIRYIDNKANSFTWALRSRICVSYCSTMIMELNGMANLSQFIYHARHKRFNLRIKCARRRKAYQSYNMPAFYLDPKMRNRQFCMYIDDVCKHNCLNCKGHDIEVYQKYRLGTYKQFKDKVTAILDK